MADITVKTNVKIGSSPVPINDVVVKFDALMVTEPITVKTGAPSTITFSISGKSPVMLLIVPVLDKDAPPLQPGNLTYAKDDKAAKTSIIGTGTHLFFNNGAPTFSGDPITSLTFWTNLDTPVKLQIIAGFSPQAAPNAAA